MQNFLEQLRWKIARFMQGRYGIDPLFRALYIIAFIFWGLSFIWPLRFLAIFYSFCIVYALYRCFSKNYTARRRELAVYQKLTGKFTGFVRRQKRRWQDRKTHRYFKCKCGTFLRVPKGKGKIKIHCQKCNRYMIKRT